MKLHYLLLVIMISDFAIANNFIEAKTEVSTSLTQYKQIAREEVLSALSVQLYSLVQTYSKLEKKHLQLVNHDDYSVDYLEKIVLHSSIPIISPYIKQSVIIDKKYVLKMILDFHHSGPIYKQMTFNLIDKIDKEYSLFLKLYGKSQKIKQLKIIKNILEEYKVISLVSMVMGYKIEKKPSITVSEIEIQLLKLKHNIYLGEPTIYYGYDLEKPY